MNNQVPDAGAGMLNNQKHGRPGEVYRCPKHSGVDCAMCGGGGYRAVCNLTACHEHGCSFGSGGRTKEDFEISARITRLEAEAGVAEVEADNKRLREALRALHGLMHHKATTPLELEAIRMSEAAGQRKRKQGGVVMATYVWCELVCEHCSLAICGEFSKGYRIPRKSLKKAASEAGAVFAFDDVFVASIATKPLSQNL